MCPFMALLRPLSLDWVSRLQPYTDGLRSSEVAGVLTLISLLVLLKLWRSLSRKLGFADGVDIGTMVDHSLASNIDSLLNRYTLIWENLGVTWSRDLERLVAEALSAVLTELGSTEDPVRSVELEEGTINALLKEEDVEDDDEEPL